jgi:hypothetical protein
MLLPEDRGKCLADPSRRIVGRDNDTDAHAFSVRIGSRTKR